METKTGQIKAISNLRKSIKMGLIMKPQIMLYAESHEPGSTFKLVDLMTLFEDKKIDTSAVFDSLRRCY